MVLIVSLLIIVFAVLVVLLVASSFNKKIKATIVLSVLMLIEALIVTPVSLLLYNLLFV